MADINSPTGTSGAEYAVTINAGDGDSVSLPEGFDLTTAEFETSGDDLIITAEDGSQVVVEGFGAGDSPPQLTTPDGAELSGDMVVQLSGGVGQDSENSPADTGSESADASAGAGEADAGGVMAGTDGAQPTAPAGGGTIAEDSPVLTGTDGEPIGNVENLSGEVWAVRPDGTRVELQVSAPVYQGDILESGPDGALGVLLADETTFSMGESGKMVLDEMIYDLGTQEGSVSLSALQGVLTFVSGQVAKTDPDAMTLDTPVATIGIRGTQVGLEIPENGEMNVVLMEEADGFVGEVVVTNDGGAQVLNSANSTTQVRSFQVQPT